MVWEHNVRVIVMATQLKERQGVVKCNRYWPSADGDEEGQESDLLELDFSKGLDTKPELKAASFTVQLLSQQLAGHYVIRQFLLIKGSAPGRLIKQFHFVDWPDFGSPSEPQSLLDFIQVVRKYTNEMKVLHGSNMPLLVHCSAGIGRTAAFITVDQLRTQLTSRGARSVDVFGLVSELRQYRPNMVQTVDQYIYIHECIEQLIEEMVIGSDEDQLDYEDDYVEMC